MTEPYRVLSLGAGLQSTLLLLLSEQGILPRLDAAIFADTHWEPAAVYETLAWLTARTSIPLYRVSAGNLGADVLQAAHHSERRTAGHCGQPPFFVKDAPNTTYAHADHGGRLWRKCTADYKIVPIRQKLRELLGLKATGRVPASVRVEQWLGFTVDEMGRTFCSDVNWITNTFPLILPLRMRREDCRRWFEDSGYPVPSKSSCTFCPFHDNRYWRDMRDQRPEEWQHTIAFEMQLHRGRLPGVRGTPYLHRSMVPLAQAPIDNPDTGQLLLCAACMGH